VLLDRLGGRTQLTLHVELPPSFRDEGMPEGWFDHVETGWRDTVDRLAASSVPANR
jgi:hypothetical protein